MYKKCKIITLPISQTPILSIEEKEIVIYKPKCNIPDSMLSICKDHLFILSDDKIKKGDWCIIKTKKCEKLLLKAVEDNLVMYIVSKFGEGIDCNKVIATTTFLPLESDYEEDYCVPKIPISFLEKYYESKDIKEVDVEYYYSCLCAPYEGQCDKDCAHCDISIPILRITSDNTIFIKPIKDR